MNNRKTNFLIGLITGIACVILSIVIIINDINIDLSKEDYITGQVTYADIRRIDYSTKHDKYRRVFYFELDNSQQNFAIRRLYENYSRFESEIKVGETVKVFYKASTKQYNTNVYQVEKGNIIIASYKDHIQEFSTKAGALLFGGLLLSIGTVLWYRKFNLLNFLNGLVGGKTNKKQFK